MAKSKFAKLGNAVSGAAGVVGRGLENMARFSGRLDPLVKVPFVGEMVADVQDIIYMLNDYFKGNYRELPKRVIIGCAVIVVYLASPIDLIPDNIPILGFLDDAFIINGIINLCVSKELDKYREWKALQAE